MTDTVKRLRGRPISVADKAFRSALLETGGLLPGRQATSTNLQLALRKADEERAASLVSYAEKIWSGKSVCAWIWQRDPTKLLEPMPKRFWYQTDLSNIEDPRRLIIAELQKGRLDALDGNGRPIPITFWYDECAPTMCLSMQFRRRDVLRLWPSLGIAAESVFPPKVCPIADCEEAYKQHVARIPPGSTSNLQQDMSALPGYTKRMVEAARAKHAPNGWKQRGRKKTAQS